MEKSFKQTIKVASQSEVQIITNKNNLAKKEADDNSDISADEDESHEEVNSKINKPIKKLDAQVRNLICFSKTYFCNLEMVLCGLDTPQESGGQGRGVQAAKVIQGDHVENRSHRRLDCE